MINIVKPGKIYDRVFLSTNCKTCDCKFTFSHLDCEIVYGLFYDAAFIKCPFCCVHNPVRLSREEKRQNINVRGFMPSVRRADRPSDESEFIRNNTQNVNNLVHYDSFSDYSGDI